MFVFWNILNYSGQDFHAFLDFNLRLAFNFVKESPVIKPETSICNLTHEFRKVELIDVEVWEGLHDGGFEYFCDAGQVVMVLVVVDDIVVNKVLPVDSFRILIVLDWFTPVWTRGAGDLDVSVLTARTDDSPQHWDENSEVERRIFIISQY